MDKIEKINYVGESMRLQDVENFFKYSVNPGLIEAKIEKATAAKLREQRGIPMPLIIAVAIVLIAGAVAYNMVSGTAKENEYIQKYVQCSNSLSTCSAGGNTQTPAANTQKNVLPPISIGG